jgi:CHAT domain-containing protein
VWDPVVARLGNVERVLIVPDGDLQRINFAALPEDDGRFLVETGPLLHYLSAERDLVSPESRSTSEGLLALGGPAFEHRTAPGTNGGLPETAESVRGRRSTCGDFRTLRFEPLPGTEREVETITGLWGEYRRDESVTLLTGTSAAESALKAQAPGHRYHLATHGFFLGSECSAGGEAGRGIGGLVEAGVPAERSEALAPAPTDPTERGVELERAGRWPEALESYEQALKYRRGTLGPEHPGVAESLVRLAMLLRKDHDVYGLEVKPLLEQAEKIDPESLSGSAGVLKKILDREFTAAEQQARELLGREKAEHGADSLEAAQVMELLAEAMREGGKANDPETRRLAERTLEIKRAVHGPEHIDVALSTNNLGILLRMVGDPAEAYRHYKMAIDMMERTVGPDHGLVSEALFNVGFAAPTTEEKIEALARSANITHHYGASGAWYTAETVRFLEYLVSDPEILQDLLDPGILPPDESPLLRSGLALAGADRREQAGPDEDDGILTAEEIAALDLSGVEWAVLSACDTGAGEVRAGEGVFGLRRAFQIAGARTLIMSLWSVDDESTREWMTALYDARLHRRLSTAESVRHASLSVLNARRNAGQSTHPFHWAAFVAAGDWR